MLIFFIFYFSLFEPFWQFLVLMKNIFDFLGFSCLIEFIQSVELIPWIIYMTLEFWDYFLAACPWVYNNYDIMDFFTIYFENLSLSFLGGDKFSSYEAPCLLRPLGRIRSLSKIWKVHNFSDSGIILFYFLAPSCILYKI